MNVKCSSLEIKNILGVIKCYIIQKVLNKWINEVINIQVFIFVIYCKLYIYIVMVICYKYYLLFVIIIFKNYIRIVKLIYKLYIKGI